MRLFFLPLAVLCVFSFAGTLSLHAQGTAADYERADKLYRETLAGKTFKASVAPHWIAGGEALWYRNALPGKNSEFIFVDVAAGKRTPAFDHAKVAGALNTALSEKFAGERLPFSEIFYADKNRDSVYFRVAGKFWKWALKDEKLSPAPAEEIAGFDFLEPRASSGNGKKFTVNFKNTAGEEVRCFWIDTQKKRVPYGKIKAGETLSQNTLAGHIWIFTDKRGDTLDLCEVVEDLTTFEITKNRRPEREEAPDAETPAPGNDISPDGLWRAEIRDNNVRIVALKSPATDSAQLSIDGSPGDPYTNFFSWSPDSKKLAVKRVKAGENRKIYMVESSPADQLQPKLHTQNYAKPGDVIALQRPVVFDIDSRRKIDFDDALFPNPWSIENFSWTKDSSEFLFYYNQRGHQVLRVIAVDVASGKTRAVIEDTSKTFVDYAYKKYFVSLPETGEILWMSERDGINRLYLYDIAGGKVKTQLTHGDYIVKRIENLDTKSRQIRFYAVGVNPGEDPYHEHLCRVNFDGTGFVVLTKGDGTHVVNFSPDMRCFIDNYSRVDLPNVNDLRRTADGSLVCELEREDISALLATGWQMPERFCAKGRDGQTDIYGMIVRPTNFDPAKKYPVIESIYAGPHGAHTAKKFGSRYDELRLAEIGFIVVRCDGMGTNWRGKTFHDIAWKNLADAGFPDRIPWIKAAAAKHPEMDLAPGVGIYGGSAGGQNAMAALLWHNDFYKAAVADCGCHDNRIDKVWWNELWMGWPADESYAKNSNVVNAGKLQGKLLLIVGELDKNVDPASTMQVVDALIKANKDFELLVLPGADHCSGLEGYGLRRHRDFFVRALLGKEPRQ